MKLPDNFEFADTNPLIVTLNGEEWVHPFINDWFTPSDDDSTAPGYDLDVNEVEFTNARGDKLSVIFKSNYVNQKLNKFNDDDGWDTLPKNAIFEPPYVDCDLVYESLDMMFCEDIWVPGPPRTTEIKNSRQYAKWRESFDSEQFRFTEFGERVYEFFCNEPEVNYFTPDRGLTTDGKVWWCDS